MNQGTTLGSPFNHPQSKTLGYFTLERWWGKDAKVKIPQKGEMGFPKAGFSPPAAGNGVLIREAGTLGTALRGGL
jgi:hypothetical protein